jgi:hypothetical protein
MSCHVMSCHVMSCHKPAYLVTHIKLFKINEFICHENFKLMMVSAVRIQDSVSVIGFRSKKIILNQ